MLGKVLLEILLRDGYINEDEYIKALEELNKIKNDSVK